MTKTSELTDDTTICDTLSPLAYNKNLRSRERERVLLPNTCSGLSDMNTTWATEQISDSLRLTAKASTNEYCSTVKFNIVDAREYALNDRQRTKKTYLVKDGDSSINGKPVYARILICPIEETF